MLTLPQPLIGKCIPCVRCAAPVRRAKDAVALGDVYFHKRCVPRCELCGRRMRADMEIYWSYQEMVVSSAVGYDRVPFHHICQVCREASLLDEPCAQD